LEDLKMTLDGYQLCTRNMIMYPDLSVCGRLFGGKLLSWIDEAMAMQAMSIMKTQNIVTKKISEVNFLAPAQLGDVLEIWGEEVKRGSSSLTMHGKVIVRREVEGEANLVSICDCTIVFVALNENGKPRAWNKK
jgi:acyl-CoA thioesterase YciA